MQDTAGRRLVVDVQEGVALYEPEPSEEDAAGEVEEGQHAQVRKHQEGVRVRLAHKFGQVDGGPGHLEPLHDVAEWRCSRAPQLQHPPVIVRQRSV